MVEYNIYGKVTFDVDFDIEADTKEQAIEKAKEQLRDYYHLNLTVVNADHKKDSVKIEINAGEYED